MPEKVFKYYTEDLALRASVVTCPEIVRQVSAIQDSYPCATMVMGRLLTGAVLMASQLGDQQSLCIRLQGDGPLGEVYAEAAYDGKIRAHCRNPHADPPHRPDGHLDIPTAVGKGVLAVSRNLPFQKQPHMGIVPIVSGEIADDLAFYLDQSHQIPSVIALSVGLNKDGDVTHAGGVLLEVIPGTPATVIQTLEKLAKAAPPLSEALTAGKDPLSILKPYIHHSPLVAVEYPHTLEYYCPCSSERVDRTLLLMGRATLSEMILKGEVVKVRCEFCGKNYEVSVTQLRTLLEKTNPQSSN